MPDGPSKSVSTNASAFRSVLGNSRGPTIIPNRRLTDPETNSVLSPPALPPPAETVFWSGAGISAHVGGPLGDELTRIVLDKLCLPGTRTAVEYHFERFGLADANGGRKFLPRLELVLDKLLPVDRTGVYETLRGTLADLEPGAEHAFFAAHLRAGGAHITVNVDNCVGKALRHTGRIPCTLRGPLHLHERLRSTDDRHLDLLGIQLEQITRGLTDRRRRLVLRLLRDARCLVFVGYSGRDFFDVTPFFRRLAREGARLENLDVVWLKHARGRRTPRLVPVADWSEGRAILEALNQAGARVRYIEAETSDWLRLIATDWGWEWAEAPRIGAGHSNGLEQSDAHRRLLATAELYAAFGLSRELVPVVPRLVKLRDAPGIPDAERRRAAELAVAGLRDAGLYRKAWRASAHLPHLAGMSPMRVAHIRGGTARLGRHYLRAGVLLVGAVVSGRRELQGTPDRGALIEFGELVITTLHWCRDMRRLPVLGRLVTGRLARALWDELDRRPDFWLGNPRAAFGFRRLLKELAGTGVYLPEPRGLDRVLEAAVDPFVETDSLIGVVNAQRSLLREAGVKGAARARDIQQLLWRSELLGDRPGVLKAAQLMPPRGPDVGTALCAWLAIEWPLAVKAAWLIDFVASYLSRPSLPPASTPAA
jgi:hypothetical protein